MREYNTDFSAEKERAENTVQKISEYRILLEKTLNSMGEENLRKLRDLRDNAEANPTDLFMFIEQLHSQNQVFDFKGKFTQLEELGYLLHEPYFSRINLSDSAKGIRDEIYIGKFGLTTDTSAKPIVTDWRAKIASVYYKYRYPQKDVTYETEEGTIHRNLELKRTFEFDEGNLIKFYNNDIQLDENDLIGAKISKRTGGVLEDIVATIQQGQMQIIEQDPRGVCIVQGCVGSGKSTVAIHKLSHIFFNYPKLIRPHSSLLVAKNQILVGYLSTLFPKLGIFDLNYGTLKDLIIRIIFGHEIKVGLDLDNEEGISGVNMALVESIRRSVSIVKKFVEVSMEKLQNDPVYSSYFTFVYDDELSCLENISALIDDLEEEVKYQKDKLDEGASGSFEARCQENIKNLKKLIKEVRKVSNNLRNTGFSNLLKEMEINGKDKLSYKDALIFTYLYSEIFGLEKFKKFEYCVVDEGQDFTVLEYLFLNKIVIKGRFCILGDLNQSYLKTGLNAWESIAEVITEARECKKFELTTNYRSTKPIIDYACGIISSFTSDFLPQSINRKGPEVSFRANLSELFSFLKEDITHLDKSVGIICFEQDDFDKIKLFLDEYYRALLKEKLVVLDPKDRIFYTPKGVYLTKFENCKGLEFAKVYVLGMERKPMDLHQAKMNYVAVTRAMNELVVFYK